ncbi:putative bifunctional diguanylate cyclase/phosphodiesterase [Paraglaciecola arctica]|uniref:Signaling protein ykoW n=1 Tax=Paraglaciecola arctica BSs20135 TaxID=493475 RepID=K6YH44_9ALTE|nr:bifunctional diguanylate cyclase/phosphodiesterase [Paraglaciecola arctica]GAC17487.1 signaling protein ykoW [Paraglaciecola arctica BSs20135]
MRANGPIKLDTSLRRRLLFGSVGLAVAVSVIFISVAYKLACDLGESMELENTNKLAKQLIYQIPFLATQSTKDPLQSKKLYNSHLFQSLDPEVVGIEIWFVGQHVKIRSYPEWTYPAEIALAIEAGVDSSGFTEYQKERLLWVYKADTDTGLSVLLLHKAKTLNIALDYVANRLSITAFLTFWLAVWAALVMSALITNRFEKNNKKLAYMASHDDLTGLPNRYYLVSMLNDFLSKVEASRIPFKQRKGALLLVDLDKFKDVNDTMGHAAGDDLLVSIGKRLTELAGAKAQVVRYGGDEFVIWHQEIDSVEAEILAQDIVAACRQPLLVNNNQFEIGASIGVACYPQHGTKVDELLKRADIAMYHAKELRLGYQLFDQTLNSKSALWVSLRGQLNNALQQNQFVLFYQPKVSLPQGTIVGVEALVRWEHPEKGLLAPGVFIDIIEQSTVIHEFTRYVLKQAIIQCRLWLNQGVRISVAVNLSPYNLRDDEFIPYLKEQLSCHQVPAELIEIELTESGTMLDLNVAQRVFPELRAVGVKLSIDDFGTGMSSLAYVKKLDVNFIKIDRSFITNITTDYRDVAVIKSMLLLCVNLNKEVIAEGIETSEQAEILHELGCKFAQGYYFGKPMHPLVITPLLTKDLPVSAKVTPIKEGYS